jgi:hypothetical protein
LLLCIFLFFPLCLKTKHTFNPLIHSQVFDVLSKNLHLFLFSSIDRSISQAMSACIDRF